MNNDVQVRIECAQCGEQLTHIRARYGDSVRMPTERERCPKCAEPTYGPLTVEMVAEALNDAASRAGGCGIAEVAARQLAMAKFVLRLFKDVGDFGEGLLSDPQVPHHKGWGEAEWRTHLLDLARQP